MVLFEVCCFMVKTVKMIVKIFGAALCALLFALNAAPGMDTVLALPNDIYVDEAGGSDRLADISAPFSVLDKNGMPVANDLSQSLNDVNGGETRKLSIELFGIPLKSINVHIRNDIYVMPCGSSVGISLWCKGVLIVGLGEVDNGAQKRCPAQEAGLRPGDAITAVNGSSVSSMNELSRLMNEAGDTATLSILRADNTFDCVVHPCIKDGEALLGAWVRESTAGIGTLSFYTMSSMRFAALGHAVTDPDAGTIINAERGELNEASILGVTQGEQGRPGEIRGTFSALSKKIGQIDNNNRYGVFGNMYAPLVSELYPQGLMLAYPNEVQEGSATLLTSLEDGKTTEYTCEIVKLFDQSASDGKSMVVKVTDERLLAHTGGIVQGMSGSPILQNGKLVGTITHVFINDPSKGYGIYAYWMYEQMN